MKSVHLVIPDLFLPRDFAAEVLAGLSLPALQKMLGRGQSEILEPVPLENLLCDLFGIPCQHDAPVAAISAAFDGLGAGCWLCADPVNLDLQRDQLLLNGVHVRSEDADTICASLNEHFAGQGMEFFAPHPQRWYVRLEVLPGMRTTPLSKAIGGNVRKLLPTGQDAAHSHRVFNEIQMLLHAHPINETREARGEPTINSVWLWGAGHSGNIQPKKNFEDVRSDEGLVEMFSATAKVPFAKLAGQWSEASGDGRQLLVWTGLRSALLRGDLAAWRSALQDFESGYAQPLWQALRSGKIDRLQVDVLGRDRLYRVQLSRGDTRAFWRRNRRLADYSLV